jgi:hypothetical protein
MATLGKSLNKLAFLLCGVLLLPLYAGAAETVEGTLRGLRCVTDKTGCAESKRDPRIRVQSDFVLVRPDGDFYYIFNIDRDTKMQFVLDTVRVTGEVNERYQSINAQRMQVRKGNTWETVWTPGRPYIPRRQPGATRF